MVEEMVAQIPGYADITSLSPDRKWLAFGDFHALVYNMETQELINTKHFVDELSWSPNSRFLLLRGEEHMVLDAADGFKRVQLNDGCNPQWMPDGRLASTTDSGFLVIQRFEDGAFVEDHCVRIVDEGNDDYVCGVVFTEDCQYVAVVQDGRLRISYYVVASGQKLWSKRVAEKSKHKKALVDVTISPNNGYIIVLYESISMGGVQRTWGGNCLMRVFGIDGRPLQTCLFPTCDKYARFMQWRSNDSVFIESNENIILVQFESEIDLCQIRSSTTWMQRHFGGYDRITGTLYMVDVRYRPGLENQVMNVSKLVHQIFF